MEKIEKDTEIHRIQKAAKELLGLGKEANEDLCFPDATVVIHVDPEIARTQGGQTCLVSLITMLGRMKSIVKQIELSMPAGISVCPNTLLDSNDLLEGLADFLESLTGEKSKHEVRFFHGVYTTSPTVRVAIGRIRIPDNCDVLIEADSFAAYINHRSDQSNWNTPFPFGPMAAAALGVAEIFKHILRANYPDVNDRSIWFLENTAHSLMTYGLPLSGKKISLPVEIDLGNIAISGVGAGGSAVVYALSALPSLKGDLTLADPGLHKLSNLARYLLSDYLDVTRRTSKVLVASQFLSRYHPELFVRSFEKEFDEIKIPDLDMVVSTTDSVESRWLLQRTWPPVILDAGVINTLYSVARITSGNGFCLGCKHPYDPFLAERRIARMWGISLKQLNALKSSGARVTLEDIERLAEAQGRDISDFLELLDTPFTEIPAISNCGDARFDLSVPNQAASLPFVTTLASITLAAEIVKTKIYPEYVLDNWYTHDMLKAPKPSLHKFRNSKSECHICGG